MTIWLLFFFAGGVAPLVPQTPALGHRVGDGIAPALGRRVG